MKKILIFNAVPTNNGDAALLFSLYNALKQQGLDVTIATHHFDLVKKIYVQYPLIRELTDYRLLNRLPYKRMIVKFMTPVFFLVRRFYRYDVLIATPGGYMNSYYGFSRVAIIFFMTKLFKKTTVIYSQSIGPLNRQDRKLMKFVMRISDLIYARDQFSFDLLKELNPITDNYCKTNDGAFLIPFAPERSDDKIVAVSVRSWKKDNRSLEQYYLLIQSILKAVVKRGYRIEFISTCQGLDGYIDDSIVAKDIVKHLEPDIKEYVYINEKYYTLVDFQKYLGKFQAVIGTRLHMCLLSMLKGIPSFNISYEVKGREAYSYLGLQDYSIDYNEPIDVAERRVDFFLDTLEYKRAKLFEIMPLQNSIANTYLIDSLRRILGSLVYDK